MRAMSSLKAIALMEMILLLREQSSSLYST
jgi:hypothetical protein